MLILSWYKQRAPRFAASLMYIFAPAPGCWLGFKQDVVVAAALRFAIVGVAAYLAKGVC